MMSYYLLQFPSHTCIDGRIHVQDKATRFLGRRIALNVLDSEMREGIASFFNGYYRIQNSQTV